MRHRLGVVERFEYLRRRGLSAAEAAAVLGVSRATVHRWRRRLAERGLRGLRPGSRRPRRLRRKGWDRHLVEAVERLHASFPAWGKEELVVLLRTQGFAVSASTVGRILAWLRQRGRIPAAPLAGGGGRRRGRPWRRRWARRSRTRLRGKAPGDVVQLDTLELRLLPGVTVYQFTAWDAASRWSVAQVYHRPTSRCAAWFLEHLRAQCPFPIRALQVDGGSEFAGRFEAACEAAGIPLYVLPPRSPKLNGGVERTQGSWRYEFYACYPLPTTLAELRPLVQWWQHVYNHLRPHQALQGLTPAEYLRQHTQHPAPRVVVSPMY